MDVLAGAVTSSRRQALARSLRRGATLVFVFSLTPSAFGQLSPGDLHEAHAFLEGVENCNQCHDGTRKGVTEGCLKCHIMVADNLENVAGLHGRQGYRDCELCHVDHQGRDFQLVYWKGGPKQFDHALTGQVLRGAHIRITCRTCHQRAFIADQESLLSVKKNPSRTFFGLDTLCAGCHLDEHRGQVQGTCDQCHTETAWRPAPGFDHGKTRFTLVGKHRATACDKCHETVIDYRRQADTAYTRYGDLGKKICSDCHQDVHKGRLGGRCADCHTAAAWRVIEQAQFDHKRTRYPLEGLHTAVACEKCHLPGRPHTGLNFTTCRDCHKDTHNGEFSRRPSTGACEECHSVSGFIPSGFSLALHQETEYPLVGAHGAVACVACHKRPGTTNTRSHTIFRFASTQCTECHKEPHDGTLKKQITAGGCESCHTFDRWQQMVFDHDCTTYALAGRHAEVPCRECHVSKAVIPANAGLRFVETGTHCNDCHADVHLGQFATATNQAQDADSTAGCDRCHTPASWTPERFDHDRDSRYALEGAHKGVPCKGCHHPVPDGEGHYVRYAPLEMTCQSCHGAQYDGEVTVK